MLIGIIIAAVVILGLFGCASALPDDVTWKDVKQVAHVCLIVLSVPIGIIVFIVLAYACLGKSLGKF